jgi:hypothetical protein
MIKAFVPFGEMFKKKVIIERRMFHSAKVWNENDMISGFVIQVN